MKNTQKKIIVVEDDAMLAEIYQTRLLQAGYKCLVAYDGVSGLALIQKELPDLAVLDIMLPEMSGVEILSSMRASDWGKNIKVLIATNISEAEAPTELDKLDFDRFIIKANLVNNQLAEAVAETLGDTVNKG